MRTGKSVLGALAGLAIGAIAGILFAPEKGSQARKQIMDKSDHYVDEVKSKFNGLRDSLTEKLKSTKKDVENLARKGNAIDVLNALIVINNDRIEGYETASKETEEPDLKKLFAQFISTSQKCKKELVREVNTLGGVEAEGTKVSGKFFRVWMDVKAALKDKDRKTILNSCEYGEDKALETYNNALMNDHLSAEQRIMINSQKSLLKADHDHIKALRDALLVA